MRMRRPTSNPPSSIKYTENREEYTVPATAGLEEFALSSWRLKQRWTGCLSIVKLLMPPPCVNQAKSSQGKPVSQGIWHPREFGIPE